MWRAAAWVFIATLALAAHALDSNMLRAACAFAVLGVMAANAPRSLLIPLTIVAGLAGAALFSGGVERLLDMLPALIAAFVAWLFARTLIGARRPLIARAIAAMDGEEPLQDPRVAAYARRLTAIWAAFQATLALIATWLALAAPAGWLGPRPFGALVLPSAVVALLLIEFLLRRRLLPQAPRHGLIGFLRELLRAWPALLRD